MHSIEYRNTDILTDYPKGKSKFISKISIDKQQNDNRRLYYTALDFTRNYPSLQRHFLESKPFWRSLTIKSPE